MIMAIYHLDVRGLLCPLPVLRARKRLNGLDSGDRLHVEATDTASEKDFAAFCAASGHLLVDTARTADTLRFVIEKR